MAYNSHSQLGMEMPSATIDPIEVEDLERQRKALERLGLKEGWLGDMNSWRTEKMKARDAGRDDLRERLLGAGAKIPPAKAASGGGLGGSVNDAAKGAAKDAAMSAMGSSL